MIVKTPGRVDYLSAWEAMRRFTLQRNEHTEDEIWLLEHDPVYTLGQAGRLEHLLPAGQNSGIPVIKTDRGGQITYHGPGQLVAYLLLDIRRRGLKVKALVSLMEQAVMACLAEYGLLAERRAGAPGVYIAGAKIAALGLRIRSGCSYHGLSLNIDTDLRPFHWINPCGYAGLKTINLRGLGINDGIDAVSEKLLMHLNALLT